MFPLFFKGFSLKTFTVACSPKKIVAQNTTVVKKVKIALFFLLWIALLANNYTCFFAVDYPYQASFLEPLPAWPIKVPPFWHMYDGYCFFNIIKGRRRGGGGRTITKSCVGHLSQLSTRCSVIPAQNGSLSLSKH